MIRSVEHLHAELQRLAFGDAEILNGREIEIHLLRPSQIIAGAVAELSGHGVPEGRRVQIVVGVGVVQNRADARVAIDAVAAGHEVGAGRIPSGGVQGQAVLQSGDGADLPSAGYLVYDSAAVQETLTFAERKIVKNRRNEAVRDIEAGQAVIAGAAARVFRRKVVGDAPDRAGVVQRFGPRIAEKRGEVGPEALAQFAGETVIVRDAVGTQILDPQPFRVGRAGGKRGDSRDRRILIGQQRHLAALRSVIAHLQRGGLAQHPLHVQQVVHAVGVAQVVIRSPSQAGSDAGRKRIGIQKVGVVKQRGFGEIRSHPGSPAQSAVEVEDGILAFLRIEDAEAGAERPLVGRAVSDTQAGGEVVVVSVDKARTEPAVSRHLHRSRERPSGHGPGVPEVEAVIEASGAGTDIDRVLVRIGLIRDVRKRLP